MHFDFKRLVFSKLQYSPFCFRHRKFSLNLCQNSKNVSANKDIYDAMKSFPSGHAQLSCFAAAFTIVSFSFDKYICLFLHFIPGLHLLPGRHIQQHALEILAPACHLSSRCIYLHQSAQWSSTSLGWCCCWRCHWECSWHHGCKEFKVQGVPY